MDYRELLQQVEEIKQLPALQRHRAKIELWRQVLRSVANGNWNGDVWAKVALQLDESVDHTP